MVMMMFTLVSTKVVVMVIAVMASYCLIEGVVATVRCGGTCGRGGWC